MAGKKIILKQSYQAVFLLKYGEIKGNKYFIFTQVVIFYIDR